MKILNIKILRGPNYWSNVRNSLVVCRIDLEEYRECPTDKIPGFAEKLACLIPSLYEHRCSEGAPGGFFHRLKEGTWLGHVIEHVALELQWLSGMKCGYGRTRETSVNGIYEVVFNFEFENAGYYAAHAAFNLVNTLITQKSYDNLYIDIAKLNEIRLNESLGISTKAIVDEALVRNIPYTRLEDPSLVMLGHGCHQQLIWTTLTSKTSAIAVEAACDKQLTKKMLRSAFIPVPEGLVISDIAEMDAAIETLGFPLVIKPINGNHGKGITTNITDRDRAAEAFYQAKKISSEIIVEHFILGNDYRFLVVNYKAVAVAHRQPAFVVGDGDTPINTLIENVNADPLRGEGHNNILTKIVVDDITKALLESKNYCLDTVLPRGEILNLKYAANLSSGGIAIDVTDKVHEANKRLAERVARVMRLDICGIDIIAMDIENPITAENGAIIEVNAGPGLRMHLFPSEGKPRNVAKVIVDMMFPYGSSSRIPIIAVTGTNGKTTTVRMIADLAKVSGYKVGYTCTDGIYVDNTLTYAGDCSGPQSAKVILQDPTVNLAVLECARGGILRSGLGFDKCDISILLNVTEDHLGLDGINQLEELLRVKSVVSHSTSEDGFAILNADDELVYSLYDELNCKKALISLLPKNTRIRQHCAAGGKALYMEGMQIILCDGHSETRLGNIKKFPVTFNGMARSNFSNILAAIMTGYLMQFDLSKIISRLEQFTPNSQNTPGRMNLFDFKKFKVLVDYAHNIGAYRELKHYLERIECSKKIGIIAVPGDRRPEDIRRIGEYSGSMFDFIIIRHEKDTRGRTNEQIVSWLHEGIDASGYDKTPLIIPDEQMALEYAIKNTALNDFIVHFPTEVVKALDYLHELSAKIPMTETPYGP